MSKQRLLQPTVVRVRDGKVYLMNRRDRGWAERSIEFPNWGGLFTDWDLEILGYGMDEAGMFIHVSSPAPSEQPPPAATIEEARDNWIADLSEGRGCNAPRSGVVKERTYVTTFCNQPHRLSNGWPVGHECYVLLPEALRLERDGDVDGAIATGVRTDRIVR